jgi:nitrogen fixation NifU-like protein
MSDAIYDDAIKAAARDRSHAGRLPSPDASVTCDNPLCGDRVTLDLKLGGDRLAEIAYKARGCLLTEAASALLARHAGERPVADLGGVVDEVRRFLDEGGAPPWPELGLFEPARRVRSRHECVLLPFEALREALQQSERGDGD